MQERPALSFVQRRVVGVLIEKALTTPDSYPLTLNAIVAGANQKQNRDPVVELEEGDISRAVHDLMLIEMVRLAPVGSSARSNRFQHNVEERLQWARTHQAVMAELLLRGPQTVGELRSRAGRMAHFADLAAVTRALDELAARQPPHVMALAREPGRSAIRHTHLFYPEDETPAVSVAAAAAAPLPAAAAETGDVLERLARLEAAVEDLQRDIAEVRAGLGSERH